MRWPFICCRLHTIHLAVKLGQQVAPMRIVTSLSTLTRCFGRQQLPAPRMLCTKFSGAAAKRRAAMLAKSKTKLQEQAQAAEASISIADDDKVAEVPGLPLFVPAVETAVFLGAVMHCDALSSKAFQRWVGFRYTKRIDPHTATHAHTHCQSARGHEHFRSSLSKHTLVAGGD